MELTDEPLPPRPRRRALTPAGAACGAVLIAALGFLAGVQVEKRSDDSSGGGSGAGALRAASFQRGAGGGQQTQERQSDQTVGQVSSLDGKAFYVTDQSGNTIRVTTNQQSKVTRSANAEPGAIHPGDTVIVEGRTASSGTVVASTVFATASNAQSALGLFGSAPGGG